VTGVGSGRFGAEEEGAEPNSEGVISGGGDGARILILEEGRRIHFGGSWIAKGDDLLKS
jgi:hypothetical protein